MSGTAIVKKNDLSQGNNTTSASTFKLLDEGEDYRVRRFELMPGKQLSCEKHLHGTKRWVIAKGAGKITVNWREIIVHSGDTVNLPVGARYSITNPCWEKLIFIEVQRGNSLREEDPPLLLS